MGKKSVAQVIEQTTVHVIYNVKLRSDLTMKHSALIPAALASLPAAALAEQSVAAGSGLTLELALSIGVPVAVGIIILVRIEGWVAAVRRLVRRRREARRRPGSSPLHPVRVGRIAEIAVRAELSCRCVRRPQVVFEGPTLSQQRKLWLVIEMCPGCEERRQTYYDVTEAQGQAAIPAQQATPVPR